MSPAQDEAPDRPEAARRPLAAGGLVALGIVFGDIGTSPLYAFRESFLGRGAALAATPANVLGVLSLIFWALIVVISIKYLLLVMRADNRGEGGIIALVVAAQSPAGEPRQLAQRPDRSWACSAPRCSTATARSRRRSRC